MSDLIQTNWKKGENKRTSRYTDLTPKSKRYQKKATRIFSENLLAPSFSQYNLTIGENPKFIWFRNAKVGTRTIFNVLDQAGAQLAADSPSNIYYPPKIYKDYFKFCFVRNPWDRLVSGWINKIIRANALNIEEEIFSKLQSLDYFIDYLTETNFVGNNPHFQIQANLIDLNEVHFIGRMENFEDDLKKVLHILNLPIVSIPTKNKTKIRKDYREYYNENLKMKVADLYQKDIQLFGYSF